MVAQVNVGGRIIGSGAPGFIIAEAGVNHNGDIQVAKKLVDAAIEAGVDAVKFQTFNAEKIVSISAPKAEYQLQSTTSDESQLEMLRRLQLSQDEHQELQQYCETQDILFLSTPFDRDSVDLLDELNVPVFKVGSGEITNWPLLNHIAHKGKPIILSTGMSYLGEVDEAVQLIQKTGNTKIVLLHCVSNYPTKPQDVNLKAMLTMAEAFGIPVGYSDHTLGLEVAFAAVALGACVIEKHLTLDRSMPGPDHRASLLPHEFRTLVGGIRNIEVALGHGKKIPATSEKKIRNIGRKSLFAAKNIFAGSIINQDSIAIKRPDSGLPPQMLPFILGAIAKVDIPRDQPISLKKIDIR